jgi:hypothetical protein
VMYSGIYSCVGIAPSLYQAFLAHWDHKYTHVKLNWLFKIKKNMQKLKQNNIMMYKSKYISSRFQVLAVIWEHKELKGHLSHWKIKHCRRAMHCELWWTRYALDLEQRHWMTVNPCAGDIPYKFHLSGPESLITLMQGTHLVASSRRSLRPCSGYLASVFE